MITPAADREAEPCSKHPARVAGGRRVQSARFLRNYYGAKRGGLLINRPITTGDRHAIVDGDRMHKFSTQECRTAMGFQANYELLVQYRLAMHMLGNAACPPAARAVILALEEAA